MIDYDDLTKDPANITQPKKKKQESFASFLSRLKKKEETLNKELVNLQKAIAFLEDNPEIVSHLKLENWFSIREEIKCKRRTVTAN